MWYKITNESSISTPAILIFPDRIQENIRRMITIAGDVSRLRPHVKTHKLAEVVKLQVEQGITKFKCATLVEMEMVANNGGEDILLAYPIFGLDIKLLFDLKGQFPNIKFAVTVDTLEACRQLSIEAESRQLKMNVFIDLDNGMHRTGIEPKNANSVAEYISNDKYIQLQGLHIYDGHIHEQDIVARKTHCDNDFESVNILVGNLKTKGIDIKELACGGTFTFPIHAKHKSRTLCPGTPLLWDAGYEENIPELDFLHAAVLVAKVISKPLNKICINLGYKALASEMAHPRLKFLNLQDASAFEHSEEHLVVSVSNHDGLSTGDIAYAIPYHVCPTIALHEKVYVVNKNTVTDSWTITARKRNYQF